MAIVQSLGSLAELDAGWAPSASYGYGALRLYDQFSYDYATLYRTQPNVRTCVDFLARNIAQLGLHVFRRVSDTDRARLVEHGLAQVLGRPLPAEYKVSRYRLIESLMGDLGVYFNAFWLKLRAGGAFGLLRVPPTCMAVYGGLVPVRYEITLEGRMFAVTPGEVVHFRGYNPANAIFGLSPLETLRRVLAEEASMGEYREHFWQNSARVNGIIERPAEAPEWGETARTRFKAEFEALYAGGANSGKTAILEEGMSWKEASFNAQESEYLAGRKLTREECARAYHIPLPMVGILDNATFSNIKEQHRNLYQDSLGPWLKMIEEEIELQLLPDFPDSQGVYCEFNIAEKLAGSFEEQTQSLQAAVGRPWMTANEARGRFNMPSLGGDAARLVTPLNVLVGGQASARDSAPGKGLEREGAKGTKDAKHEGREAQAGGLRYKAAVDGTLRETRERHVAKWGEVLSGYFRRQQAALVGRVRPGAGIETVWSEGARWDGELGDDLFGLSMATATVFAGYVGQQVGAEVDAERMTNYVRGYAERSAVGINGMTRDLVAEALRAAVVAEALKGIYDLLAGARAEQIAAGSVTAMSNFGGQEGAQQSGLRTKTWIHGGAKEPRTQHVAMAGETVGIGELFSNGARWPGDPSLSVEETAYCHCSVSFGTGSDG